MRLPTVRTSAELFSAAISQHQNCPLNAAQGAALPNEMRDGRDAWAACLTAERKAQQWHECSRFD